MLAIYLKKNWVESIGNAADLILIEKVKGDYDIVLASDKNLSFSGAFVGADVCRHPGTVAEKKEAFIPTKIPSDVIVAIFDFTEVDSKKIGFASSRA
jgi:hypothetical protein